MLATKSLNVAMLVLATGSAWACPFCGQVRNFTTGDLMDMGNGTVRTWVHLDKDKKPDAIGITFTATALEGLPTEKPDNGEDGYEFTLKLPKEASVLPFDHIAVDWNPKGHIPDPIYTVPHFDFHFYMMSPAERMKITAKGDDLKKCQNKPSSEYLPKNFMYAPESELAFMGSHWVDVTTPELHGKPFTQTFIYGTYDSKVVFVEPMVSMAYLKSKPDATFDLPQPEKLAIKGKLFPTKYHIAFDEKRQEYMIVFSGFARR